MSCLRTDDIKYMWRLKGGNNSFCLEIRRKHEYDVTMWRRKGKGIPSRETSKSKGTEAWKYLTCSGSGRLAGPAGVQDAWQVCWEISLENRLRTYYEGALLEWWQLTVWISDRSLKDGEAKWNSRPSFPIYRESIKKIKICWFPTSVSASPLQIDLLGAPPSASLLSGVLSSSCIPSESFCCCLDICHMVYSPFL